jgi:hypothetical protein
MLVVENFKNTRKIDKYTAQIEEKKQSIEELDNCYIKKLKNNNLKKDKLKNDILQLKLKINELEKKTEWFNEQTNKYKKLFNRE